MTQSEASDRATPQPGDRPLDTRRPFLRQDGLRAGLSKHRLDSSAYTRLFGSVRLLATVPVDVRTRCLAAALVAPDVVVSHHTAAELWGGIVPETTLTHVAARSRDQRRPRRGLALHHAKKVRTTTHRGVLVTTPEQTFCDLASTLTLVDLVILGDSLVQKRATTPEALVAAVEQSTDSHRARARRAADLVRERVDSPMETRVRLMIVFAGLPEPVVNLQVGGDGVSFRLDLAWPELNLAVEYDGRHHAEDAHQWGHDLSRREWLDGSGWRLIVLRAEDVFGTPWASIVRIVEAMRPRGYDKPVTTPPAAFAEHFPGRRRPTTPRGTLTGSPRGLR